jgi:hypothetical protein
LFIIYLKKRNIPSKTTFIWLINKVKNPVTGPVMAQGGTEVQLYSSKTSVLEGGEWSAACPGHTLPLGKTRYQLYRRLGGPQGRSGWAENLAPTGIQSLDG